MAISLGLLLPASAVLRYQLTIGPKDDGVFVGIVLRLDIPVENAAIMLFRYR